MPAFPGQVPRWTGVDANAYRLEIWSRSQSLLGLDGGNDVYFPEPDFWTTTLRVNNPSPFQTH